MSSSLETMSCADIMMYMNQKEDNDKAKAAAEAKELFATIKHVLINPFVNDLVAGRSVETTKTAREIQMQWYDTVFNLICRGNKTLARAVFTEYGWFVETFALESAVQVVRFTPHRHTNTLFETKFLINSWPRRKSRMRKTNQSLKAFSKH